MRERTRSTLALFLAAGWLAACGGDASDREPPPDEGEPTAATTPAGGAPDAAEPPDPDVRGVEFAESLEVDLDAMEPRPSGLYVQVLEAGEGPPAEPGDSMGVHYTVWFADGRKLDSSRDGEPSEPLAMVLGETPLIDGWTEGVTGMRLGERRRLVVPYDLAYGARGRPPQVPPYSTLVFEVELARHAPG